MNLLELDHLALSCETLANGARHVEQTLGVSRSNGGEHDAMGTHNKLLGLGPDIYFEAIAINPKAPTPSRPRWFNIDNFAGPPRMSNWIVRTQNMAAALDQLGPGFGRPMHLERGDLRWTMAVPEDGILPWGGWGPAIIEWHGGAHPAARLPDVSVRLNAMVLRHPNAEDMAATLAPLLPRDTILFEPHETPNLTATLQTPDGPRILE